MAWTINTAKVYILYTFIHIYMHIHMYFLPGCWCFQQITANDSCYWHIIGLRQLDRPVFNLLLNISVRFEIHKTLFHNISMISHISKFILFTHLSFAYRLLYCFFLKIYRYLYIDIISRKSPNASKTIWIYIIKGLSIYYQVPTCSALHRSCATKYQPVPPSTDPVPSSTNQYCPVLTQHQHISTSTILHWPSTTKKQPVPPSTDPVQSSTNQYHLLLTQYHHISYSNVRLSFGDLRWAQLYDSLVYFYAFQFLGR